MRLWTLQAPEVVATLRSTGNYRADWELVTGNWCDAFRDMTAEMERRGMNCRGAPPIWCWPGRALHRGQVRDSARSLLSYPEWVHGRWLLKLDVPDELALATSYAVWNDYLGYTTGFQDGPEQMDWSGQRTSEWDELQVTIPELRSEWVVRARPYPPDADTVAAIRADPDLRDEFARTGSPRSRRFFRVT